MKLNYKVLFKILGLITFIAGIAMIPCIFLCIHYKEAEATSAFTMPCMLLLLFGGIAFFSFKNYKTHLSINDGYFIACMSWIYSSLLGTIPFIIQGYSIVDSVFEAISGFTTTGANVIPIDELPMSLILWKAILNWAGGMGILVLVVSVFPSLGISGQSIASQETTGPTLQKIGARFSDTGKFLYITYISFTLIEFLLLVFVSPLGVFDSLVNSFSTISTSGIYVRNGDLTIYSSIYTRGVIMFFTILSSMNYTLFYLLLNGKYKEVLKDTELRTFLGIIVATTILIACSLSHSKMYSSFGTAIKDSFFQVVSFISTSGYFVCDFNKWPTFCIVILFTLLFVGGCSMSTSGSLKVVRIITLFKLIKRGVFIQIHPSSTKAIVIGGKAIPAKQVSSITSHIILYFIIFFSGMILLSFNDLSMNQTITASLGMFTNTGVMLGEAEITGYLTEFNNFSLIVMSILMIAGRLEIYSLLLMFTKSFWVKDSATYL